MIWGEMWAPALAQVPRLILQPVSLTTRKGLFTNNQILQGDNSKTLLTRFGRFFELRRELVFLTREAENKHLNF